MSPGAGQHEANPCPAAPSLRSRRSAFRRHDQRAAPRAVPTPCESSVTLACAETAARGAARAATTPLQARCCSPFSGCRTPTYSPLHSWARRCTAAFDASMSRCATRRVRDERWGHPVGARCRAGPSPAAVACHETRGSITLRGACAPRRSARSTGPQIVAAGPQTLARVREARAASRPEIPMGMGLAGTRAHKARRRLGGLAERGWGNRATPGDETARTPSAPSFRGRRPPHCRAGVSQVMFGARSPATLECGSICPVVAVASPFKNLRRFCCRGATNSGRNEQCVPSAMLET